MKLTLSVLMIVAAGIVRASGDAVSCSVIDYLYYSSDCCDNSNSVQCMESIPQTDKAAIDNLASLKRPDGAACETGDSIKFLNSKIVCTDAESCLIPCVNGNITGSESTSCACACNAGFSGVDCSTADPTTTAAPAATTTTTTAAPAAPAGPFDANDYALVNDADAYTKTHGAFPPLTQAECQIYHDGLLAGGQVSGTMEVRDDETTREHCVWDNDNSKVIYQQKSGASFNLGSFPAVVKKNCHYRGDCVIGTGCEDRYACADGACVSNACAAPQANGQSCASFFDCQNACISSTGLCGDPQADGATCAHRNECANTCLTTTNQCAAKLATGDACGSWSDCDSGNCQNDNTCQ